MRESIEVHLFLLFNVLLVKKPICASIFVLFQGYNIKVNINWDSPPFMSKLFIYMLPFSRKPEILRLHALENLERARFIS